jgi:hypothetical protein
LAYIPDIPVCYRTGASRNGSVLFIHAARRVLPPGGPTIFNFFSATAVCPVTHETSDFSDSHDDPNRLRLGIELEEFQKMSPGISIAQVMSLAIII